MSLPVDVSVNIFYNVIYCCMFTAFLYKYRILLLLFVLLLCDYTSWTTCLLSLMLILTACCRYEPFIARYIYIYQIRTYKLLSHRRSISLPVLGQGLVIGVLQGIVYNLMGHVYAGSSSPIQDFMNLNPIAWLCRSMVWSLCMESGQDSPHPPSFLPWTVSCVLFKGKENQNTR